MRCSQGRSSVESVLRGTGCVTWFAFTLGLSVVGEQRGQPSLFLAAGMTGYAGAHLGGGGLVTSAVAVLVLVQCQTSGHGTEGVADRDHHVGRAA